MKLIILVIMFSVLTVAQNYKLKILTFNVWSGLDYCGIIKVGEFENIEKRELRFKNLLREIIAVKPDIIFLQEANPVNKYAARLSESLGFDEIHQVCNAGIKIGPFGFPINLQEGIVILADKKLKLRQYDVWKLGGSFGVFGDAVTIHFDESNFALVGKILIDNSPLYLVNVHLLNDVPKDSIMKLKYEDYCYKNSISNSEKNNTYKIWGAKIYKLNHELETLNEYINKFYNYLIFL